MKKIEDGYYWVRFAGTTDDPLIAEVYAGVVAITWEDHPYRLEEFEILAPVPSYESLPKKDYIDWSHVSKSYNYMARDANGNVYLYENKPRYIEDRWTIISGGVVKVRGSSFDKVSSFASFKMGNLHWKETLVERDAE